ncbi:MAG: hypothetical protein IPM96_21205 [Ignavibacteria bacterium]|nr:hypothetical protein [Ignavibacteria bacterium]
MSKYILSIVIPLLLILLMQNDVLAQGAKSKKPGSTDKNGNERVNTEESVESENKTESSTENYEVDQTEVITKDYVKGEPIELNDSVAIVIEATNGEFKSMTGDIVVEGCEFESASYESTLIDLNNDGNPEVIIFLNSGCMGGNTGRYSYLYVKNKKGVWEMILEDIGTPITLEEKNHSWPEIYFAKAGHHYNLYKWNGKKYVFDRMHSPYD